MFGGKAAPGYAMAKLIIRLINAVADVVNHDPGVPRPAPSCSSPTTACRWPSRSFPAADLSEQISTAGMEASGTGNMKFALNGALTIGTMDGANVEIREEVGDDNIFIFGLTADEVAARRPRYDPWALYRTNAELARVLDMIRDGAFSPRRARALPAARGRAAHGRRPLLPARRLRVVRRDPGAGGARCTATPAAWTRKSILNVAGMGKFSSDRTIREYAQEIWGVTPVRF